MISGASSQSTTTSEVPATPSARHSSPVAAAATDAESVRLSAMAKKIDAWWRSPRFAHTKRPYTARDVAALRNTVPITYPSAIMADKLWATLHQRYARGEASRTFGALDPIQVAQMAPHVDCVYVSGWQCAATASTTNEPGPDFADYPMNTVPNKVDQLFRAQLFQDRRQAEERARMTPAQRSATPTIDFLRPMIADMDTGHGGMPAVMRLMKLMVEAGVGGVHIEDQKPGSKKCGHMGGKVLVSTREHCDRLVAARLQADIMGAATVIVARTDADSARLLDNNIDPRDHPFILGTTNPALEPLDTLITRMSAEGASGPAMRRAQEKWMASANLCRYEEAVAQAIEHEESKLSQAERANVLAQWHAQAGQMSNPEARKFATKLGYGHVHWDWDAPRSREGYYRVGGGVDFCAMRARAYSNHSDLIWMETSTPDISIASEFAMSVHATHPHLKLAYNLSPSFNWDAAGMSDEEIADFPKALGRLGFCWQFITLAGFHVNALATTRLARALANESDSVLAYVRDVQRKERDEGVSTLTHQKWAGAALADNKAALITGALSEESSMHASTEAQFAKASSKL